MENKERLELAAKAIGCIYANGALWAGMEEELWAGREIVKYEWCPPKDDGDSQRLAVALRMKIEHDDTAVKAATGEYKFSCCFDAEEDRSQALRSAIFNLAVQVQHMRDQAKPNTTAPIDDDNLALNMLVRAAEAVGLQYHVVNGCIWLKDDYESPKDTRPWNPYKNYGEALALLIMTGGPLNIGPNTVRVGQIALFVEDYDSKMEAVCHAIVEDAASRRRPGKMLNKSWPNL